MSETKRSWQQKYLLVHGWELWGPFVVGAAIVGGAYLGVLLGAR